MNTAIRFIILIGIVDLLADATYEGARSIAGQYLAILGATGTTVGIVSGFGEFIGYTFRFISGYFSDKSGKYWLITFVGYAINLLAVPLLALANNWPLAAALLITERFGRAIRAPARDAMLSYATQETGRGWGFGLHAALDQTGAILGPLAVSLVLYFQGTYQMSFAMLLIPALCALTVLFVAWKIYPQPQELEKEVLDETPGTLTHTFWVYLAAICCIAAGYVDFPLIAYHFEKAEFPKAWIPIFFAVAMAMEGLSALICGKQFDKIGIRVLIYSTALAAFFVPLVFLTGFYGAFLGVILWGIGFGAQESVMRAVVAHIIRKKMRGTAYGVMNMCFGTAWFLGSALIGYLYDVSIPLLIAFSVAAQLAAIPIFRSLKI